MLRSRYTAARYFTAEAVSADLPLFESDGRFFEAGFFRGAFTGAAFWRDAVAVGSPEGRFWSAGFYRGGFTSTNFWQAVPYPLACTVDWGLWDVDSTFRDPDVSANRANVYRKTTARTGLVEAGHWRAVAACVPFQHVATRIPQTVVDGMVVPGGSANLFRFPANLDLRPGDVIFWRTGGRAETVWMVTEEPSKHVPLAKVLLADVERQAEAEDDLEVLFPA